ncbi:hypothetical protein EXQ36_07040 [Clostridium botulinum]|nr:hypothetical protein [Clostridium botulinum]
MKVSSIFFYNLVYFSPDYSFPLILMLLLFF